MKKLLPLIIFICAINLLKAQEIETPKKTLVALGVELQGYPTGLISGLRSEIIFNNKNAINLRIGYNYLNHRDLGKHATEKGGGFGFSLGWRRYFENEGLKGFFIGARSDVWFNKVDWQNFKGNNELLISGRSNIVVLQPTIEAGYKVQFAKDLLSFEPSLGFGLEWNVKTDGQISFADPTVQFSDEIFETGQGPIFLLGFSFMIALNKQ